MAKVIEVKFQAQQGAEELYTSAKRASKVYIRQAVPEKNRVIWLTATKCKDGHYEADTPIKAGVTIRVISGPKKEKVVLFEEQMEADETDGTLSAEKKEHFAAEQLKAAVKEYIKKMSLHTYESWSKWLLNECTRYDYTGYQDNWLHFGTVPSEAEEIGTLEVMGLHYTVVMTEWRHMVCSNVWKVVEIRDAKSNVLELCGYAFAS